MRLSTRHIRSPNIPGRRSVVVVRSLPQFDLPDLKKWHGPLPTFVMQRFLEPGWRNEVAIIDGSSPSLESPAKLTFEQLYTQTFCMAQGLKKELQLGPGDIVAIMSPNHINYFSVFHGLALTGAISTTINPQYTADEVKYQIELTRAKALIVHPMCLDVAKQAAGGRIPVLSLVETPGGAPSVASFLHTSPLSAIDTDAFLGGSRRNERTFDDQSLVTIPFSSGTTGRAKGVMLTHRNITCNILQTMPLEGKYLMPEFSKSGQRGTMLCPLPFYHIYGKVAGMCLPLYAGGKLIFMSSFDLQRYLELIQTHKVTRGHVVPPIVLALAKHPLVEKYDLSSLETLMSGAAPLGAEVQLQASRRLGCLVKQVGALLGRCFF